MLGGGLTVGQFSESTCFPKEIVHSITKHQSQETQINTYDLQYLTGVGTNMVMSTTGTRMVLSIGHLFVAICVVSLFDAMEKSRGAWMHSEAKGSIMNRVTGV